VSGTFFTFSIKNKGSPGKKRISQRDMVKKLEMYQTTLVTYETGRREPRVGFLKGLIKPELSDFCGD
jgi:hypothetical protein